MLGPDAQAMAPREHRVLGNHGATVADLPNLAYPQHLDRRPDQAPGHRVTVGVDRHQPVACDYAQSRHPRKEPSPGPQGRERRGFGGEALDRRLVRRAVHPAIGNLELPGEQLVVKVLQIAKHPPGHEVALHVLHPGFHLALGLRPVRAAHPRLEPPVLGERGKGRIPALPALMLALDHRAHAVVQDLAGHTPEVLEGVLVRREQRLHPLVRVALGPAAARVPQRHHEDVYRGDFLAQAHPHLAPVDLRLLTGPSLEAALRERTCRRLLAQWPHGAAHGLVAASETVARLQLLVQDPRRVAHLRRTLLEPRAVRIQQRLALARAPVPLPAPLAHAPAHGLAVQPRRTRNRRHRHPTRPQAVNLFPTLLANHRFLRAQPGHGNRSLRRAVAALQGGDSDPFNPSFPLHVLPPWSGGGEISFAISGEFRIATDITAIPKAE